MIETIENGLQLLLTGVCTFIAVEEAVRFFHREWLLLGLFSASFFLGDLYWLLFLVFYRKSPDFSFISDMGWIASLLFLYLLLFNAGDGRKTEFRKVLYLVPVFTAGMCAFYMQWGSYLINLLYAVVMTLILWRAAGSLLSIGGDPKRSHCRMIYQSAILFCLLEYALWTASCFFEGETIANPYYWFDIMLSVTFLLFVPAVRKAVNG